MYPKHDITGTNWMDGNRNSICLGYPALDMVGWGDPTTWYPDHCVQTFYGAYQWSNTLTLAGVTTNLIWEVQLFGATSNANHNVGLYGYHGLKIPAPTDLIVENRDFFNYPRPGYTPAAYPHPLQAKNKSPADDRSPQPPGGRALPSVGNVPPP